MATSLRRCCGATTTASTKAAGAQSHVTSGLTMTVAVPTGSPPRSPRWTVGSSGRGGRSAEGLCDATRRRRSASGSPEHHRSSSVHDGQERHRRGTPLRPPVPAARVGRRSIEADQPSVDHRSRCHPWPPGTTGQQTGPEHDVERAQCPGARRWDHESERSGAARRRSAERDPDDEAHRSRCRRLELAHRSDLVVRHGEGAHVGVVPALGCVSVVVRHQDMVPVRARSRGAAP